MFFSIQEQEEHDFCHATIREVDQYEANLLGVENPDCEWILTGADVWHRNPFFTGTPGPHPEYDDLDQDDLDSGELDSDWAGNDDIPF